MRLDNTAGACRRVGGGPAECGADPDATLRVPTEGEGAGAQTGCQRAGDTGLRGQ